ncbi:MAG: tRNA lysidine(34) synthetase TilS [Chitinophagales bacterium]|nr:tRNA lysidine(34) synthetase TilS [Chitinophagales bacterium]
MQDGFKEYIKSEKLVSIDESTLLAVSGGLDSMVMMHLFHSAGFACGVAHCNFQLRGQAADGDELFVKEMASKLHLPFYSIQFDTVSVAKARGISIQMAARELRYQWLEKIRQQEGYSKIATAHHLNDNIETLLYNLSKGCGIRGLHGIPAKNGCLIRPLGFASRSELESYQQNQRIAYREDASNSEIKYSRNKIRHKILPVLKALNPSLESTMEENIQRFREAEYLYEFAVQMIKKIALNQKGNLWILQLSALSAHQQALPTILYELLTPFGLNSRQAGQMATSIINGQTGAVFHSDTHSFLVDRITLQIKQEEGLSKQRLYELQSGDQNVLLSDGVLSLDFQEGQPSQISADPYIAMLDAGNLKFPLSIRHWKAGDVFQPLGMKGRHQKVQDFFSNNKLSRFEKENVWVVEDANEQICWLIGYRLDDRYKIKSDTKAHWVLNFIPQ